MSDDGVEFIGPKFYPFESFSYILPCRDRTTYLAWALRQQRNPRAGLDFPLPLLPDENAKKVKVPSQPEVSKSEFVEKNTGFVEKPATSVGQPTDSLKRLRDSIENDGEEYQKETKLGRSETSAPSTSAPSKARPAMRIQPFVVAPRAKPIIVLPRKRTVFATTKK